MKRLLIALTAVAALIPISASPASAVPEHCTKGNIQALVNAGELFGEMFLSGSRARMGEVWAKCQFRALRR